MLDFVNVCVDIIYIDIYLYVIQICIYIPFFCICICKDVYKISVFIFANQCQHDPVSTRSPEEAALGLRGP